MWSPGLSHVEILSLHSWQRGWRRREGEKKKEWEIYRAAEWEFVLKQSWVYTESWGFTTALQQQQQQQSCGAAETLLCHRLQPIASSRCSGEQGLHEMYNVDVDLMERDNKVRSKDVVSTTDCGDFCVCKKKIVASSFHDAAENSWWICLLCSSESIQLLQCFHRVSYLSLRLLIYCLIGGNNTRTYYFFYLFCLWIQIFIVVCCGRKWQRRRRRDSETD